MTGEGSIVRAAMRSSLVFVVHLAAGAAACSTYHVSSARMGAVYTSKGQACDVRFENLSFLEARSKYEHIGMITLTGAGDEFTDAEKHDVVREVCKMGGDVATLNVSTQGNYQFMVWRRSQ
jgi:hypothetical protein